MRLKKVPLIGLRTPHQEDPQTGLLNPPVLLVDGVQTQLPEVARVGGIKVIQHANAYFSVSMSQNA